MDEILYHPEVFMPNWFEVPTERAVLRYSRHAMAACGSKRGMPVFESIPLCRFELVELGVRKNKVNQLGMPARPPKVSKIVMRGHYDDKRDIVFVLIPEDEYYFVKTCWYNNRTDRHKTLDRTRYATA